MKQTSGILICIAGFGHVAVGLVSGRLFAESSRTKPLVALLGFSLLAMLPDFDVFWVGLGVHDHGLQGHRGFTHTPVFALALGLIAGLVARRRGWDIWRAVMAVTLVLGSHGVLDALAQEGRGIMFLWPLTDARYHFPWRPIPDAPTGLAFFSRKGMQGLAIELIYFLPFVFYAIVLPRLRRRQRRPIPVPASSSSVPA